MAYKPASEEEGNCRFCGRKVKGFNVANQGFFHPSCLRKWEREAGPIEDDD